MAEVMRNNLVESWVVSAEEEQAFRSTDASFAWLCQLPSEYMRQFAGRWIAVQDCRIVASADTLEALRGQCTDSELARAIIHRVERPGKVIYR
jgi:hypothetical protein